MSVSTCLSARNGAEHHGPGRSEPIIVWKDPETGLSCVVDGRQRVRHTLEANKRLSRGKEPLLVPESLNVALPYRMAQAMVSANEIRRPDTPLGRAKKNG